LYTSTPQMCGPPIIVTTPLETLRGVLNDSKHALLLRGIVVMPFSIEPDELKPTSPVRFLPFSRSQLLHCRSDGDSGRLMSSFPMPAHKNFHWGGLVKSGFAKPAFISEREVRPIPTSVERKLRGFSLSLIKQPASTKQHTTSNPSHPHPHLPSIFVFVHITPSQWRRRVKSYRARSPSWACR